jgi:hypothetical protein
MRHPNGQLLPSASFRQASSKIAGSQAAPVRVPPTCAWSCAVRPLARLTRVDRTALGPVAIRLQVKRRHLGAQPDASCVRGEGSASAGALSLSSGRSWFVPRAGPSFSRPVKRPMYGWGRCGRLVRDAAPEWATCFCAGPNARQERLRAPLRVRRIERVRLHADLVMLARLSQALNRARAVPMAA